MPTPPQKPRLRGFTLIELVVVIIILGVLAAVAAPAFLDVGKAARIASLKALAGTISSMAENVRVMCMTNPACDYSANQIVTIGGRSAWLSKGWPEAGDNLNGNQIDIWITYSGFTASLPANTITRFSLDGAPDPTTCYVDYRQATSPTYVPITNMISTGC